MGSKVINLNRKYPKVKVSTSQKKLWNVLYITLAVFFLMTFIATQAIDTCFRSLKTLTICR